MRNTFTYISNIPQQLCESTRKHCIFDSNSLEKNLNKPINCFCTSFWTKFSLFDWSSQITSSHRCRLKYWPHSSKLSSLLLFQNLQHISYIFLSSYYSPIETKFHIHIFCLLVFPTLSYDSQTMFLINLIHLIWKSKFLSDSLHLI